MIRIVGKRGKGSFESQLDDAAKGVKFEVIDCTSGNTDPVMRELSPFYLGPVECYDGLVSQTFELSWQCAKVYPWMTDGAGNPGPKYFAWRDAMWAKKYPDDFAKKSDIRYPAGKGNAKACLYQWWKTGGGFRKLGYIEGRKEIYLPNYAKAVTRTEAYRRLEAMRDEGKNLMLVDFDGYNRHLPQYGFSYNDVIHCPLLKMGHGFVLGMLLEGVLRVENGAVKAEEGLLTPPPAGKEWPAGLRCLSQAAKDDRAAAAMGITTEELRRLDDATKKWLRKAASREECAKRGIARAKWKRMPLAEKLTYR